MKKTVLSPVGAGLIALITIMLVLVLAVFSVLTLASARADLVLSERGAESVTEYYAADSAALKLVADFMDGTAAELETVVPINDMRGLYVHVIRNEEGDMTTRAWQVILLADFSEMTDPARPVWPGNGL